MLIIRHGAIPTGRFLYGCTYLYSPNCDYCDVLDDLTNIVVTYSRLSGIFQLTKTLIRKWTPTIDKIPTSSYLTSIRRDKHWRHRTKLYCEERNISSTKTESMWTVVSVHANGWVGSKVHQSWTPRRLRPSHSKPVWNAILLCSFWTYILHEECTYIPSEDGKASWATPEIHQHFKEGIHGIRRSDRCWSELSPDLVIEQCLMRSLRRTGGLTRGRGVSETQRLLWVLSMPACAPCSNSLMWSTAQVSSTKRPLMQELKGMRMIHRKWYSTYPKGVYSQLRPLYWSYRTTTCQCIWV